MKYVDTDRDALQNQIASVFQFLVLPWAQTTPTSPIILNQAICP